MSRILIVAPAWIGDTLLAQPLFARIREADAVERLDALAPPWTAPILARMPEIDEVIESPFAHGELRLADRWRLARSLAAHRYERAIVLPNTFKSALVPWLARIPRREGFVGEARYGVLNVRHRLDPAALPLMAERYAKLAEGVDEPPRRPLPEARLRVDSERRAELVARLSLAIDKPTIAFCPGAEYGPAKRWPVGHFTALARRVGALGHQVWLFGSSKDADAAAAIHTGAPEATVNLAGRTSLADVIDLMSLVEAVVANDSGLMHIAAALDRPLVALYGSSSPDHTPPLSAHAQLVTLGLSCSPCFARECPLGHFRCMRDLAPERVLEALDRAGKAHGRPATA